MNRRQDTGRQPGAATYYERHKDELETNRLEDPLTVQNYKEKFHYLLCWEQREHEKQLAERCSANTLYNIDVLEPDYVPKRLQYERDENYDRFGYITCIGDDDNDALEYAKQASGASLIQLDTTVPSVPPAVPSASSAPTVPSVLAKHVQGSLPSRVNPNAILIGLTMTECEKLRSVHSYNSVGPFTFTAKVEFEFRHFHFDQVHNSLDYLQDDIIRRLNPTKKDLNSYKENEFFAVSRSVYECLKLDRLLQMNALYTILKSPPTLPVLISGPFGTGKTRVLARAAYELLSEGMGHRRVLICAYQQASVDGFLEYFGEIKTNRERPWDVDFVRVIPNKSMKIKSEVRKKYRRFVKTKAELSQQDLEMNRLVITTFSTSSALRQKLPHNKKRGFFTDILLDEGAQTREPETVIPLCLAGPQTRIVIAGDHCQVGPKSVVLGKEARSSELGTSLLERLYTNYASSEMTSKNHDSCYAMLLINYRCHSGILMLPSSLYYLSTLQCRVPDSTAHHLAPFPLTFVCSSIQQDLDKTSGVDKMEADVLIDEIKKYLKEPPRNWGENDKICIMSPSPNQCAVLRKKARNLDINFQVEVLNAYNIQGNEFRAVFISTSETTDNGQPLNQTRSLCDRYVFNTALTRSQSLVVAVGNPFSLLKTEAYMIEMHGDSFRTWTPYIQQCVECSTFMYAKSAKTSDPSGIVDTTYQLYKLIYSSSVNNDAPVASDALLGAYKEMFDNIRANQSAQAALSGSSRERKREYKEVKFSDTYICMLVKETYRIAEAIPEDPTKKRVKIRGTFNLRGAFDGDRVEVGVFEDSLSADGSSHHGRILQVVPFEDLEPDTRQAQGIPTSTRSANKRRNLKFVCRVYEQNSNIFYPIDGKNPGFCNLRKLNKVILKNSEGPIDYASSEVLVYDPSSFNDQNKLPRIVRCIPKSVALEMLFIVSYVKWGKNHFHPLGLVTGACRKGHTPYNAERLLKLEYSIEYDEDSDQDTIAVDTEEARSDDALLEAYKEMFENIRASQSAHRAIAAGAPSGVDDEDTGSTEDPTLYDRAFTIDPPNAKNLDDAFTILPLLDGKTYKLGVHIVNAAKHIAHGSAVDQSARDLGTSVYGGKHGTVRHMLRERGFRRTLSLTPGEIRDVISVTCTVEMNPFRFDNVCIEPARVRSCDQLTYSQAQDALDRAPNSVHSHLFDSLELLYGISKELRRQRFQSDAAYSCRVDDNEEINSWQAHKLVEELMIWANNEVAKHIRASYPDAALLCRQGVPKSYEEVLEEVTSDYDNKCIMVSSPELSQHLNSHEIIQIANADVSICIPQEYTLPHIQRALRENDKNVLLHLLSTDRYYPQFEVLNSKFRSSSSRAEYCCTTHNADPLAYRHQGLHLDNYTHFTSPMRRYIDIVVQRMLLVDILQQQDRKFIHDEHAQLCVHLNRKKKQASDFERRAKIILFAGELKSDPKPCTAFITCKSSKGVVELGFPDLQLKYFSPKNKDLKIATTFIPAAKDSDLFVWRLHITSLKADLGGAVMTEMLTTLLGPRTNLLSEAKDDARSLSLDKEKLSGLKKSLLSDDFSKLSLNEKMSTTLPGPRKNASEVNDDVTAFCLSDEFSLDEKKFSLAHRDSVLKVPAHEWSSTILEFVRDPTEEKMEAVEELFESLTSSNSLPAPQEVPDALEAIDRNTYPFLDCDIKTSLNQSDVLKLWLTWSAREPWISSAVQLVQISPLLHICIQHNSHPAECFSDPNLVNASRKSYANMDEYIELWKKVLLAEATEKSVQECQPVIIRDVILKWPDLKIPDNCIEEIYYVPTGPVEMTLPKHFVEHCYEFFRVGVGDLVCVRYGCDPHQSARAVYHFVVHEVKEKEPAEGRIPPSRAPENGERENRKETEKEGPKEVTVTMKPVGEINCRVSQHMREMLEQPCEVQIVTLGFSYRKVFRGLLALSRHDHKVLSRNIAIDPHNINRKRDSSRAFFQAAGITVPEYSRARRIADRDELAKSISKWSTKEGEDIKLNDSQFMAMKKSFSSNFQLIQGPPGTGKSVTGARIAYVFAQDNKSLSTHKCVLYCGPSNKSVDVVFEKFVELVDKNSEVKIRILRIYSSAVERKDFPGPKYHTRKQAANTTCPEWAQPYALHHMIRQAEQSAKLVELDEKLKVMRRKKKIPNGKFCNEYRRALRDAEDAFLSKEKFDIVFCTCNEASAGRIKRRIIKPDGQRLRHFNPRQCIIDECGMAYEPETIVPIDLCEHAVLIGDHKQLQPVIDYQPAKECGLTTSLFERYAAHYTKFLYPLNIQYRMHRAICSFPSEQFYNSDLRTAQSVLDRKDDPNLASFWPIGNGAPIMFVDVVGAEGQDIAGTKRETRVGVDSKYNLTEAKLVIEIARVLHINHKVDLEEIAVLSPYSAQKNKIMGMLKDRTDNLKNLKVASITESQGDEYGYVILSTVRSQPLEEINNEAYMEHDRLWMKENLGFITDEHQICVGITRSKYGLIITGNKTLLKYCFTWKRLLKHYQDRKCVVDASRFGIHQ